MSDPPANIQVIKPSRKKPQQGDVFAIRLLDNSHLFGRVVGADIQDPRRAPMPGAYLVYVYRERAASMQPDLDALTTERLLLPPVFINAVLGQRATLRLLSTVSLSRQTFSRSTASGVPGGVSTSMSIVTLCLKRPSRVGTGHSPATDGSTTRSATRSASRALPKGRNAGQPTAATPDHPVAVTSRVDLTDALALRAPVVGDGGG